MSRLAGFLLGLLLVTAAFVAVHRYPVAGFAAHADAEPETVPSASTARQAEKAQAADPTPTPTSSPIDEPPVRMAAVAGPDESPRGAAGDTATPSAPGPAAIPEETAPTGSDGFAQPQAGSRADQEVPLSEPGTAAGTGEPTRRWFVFWQPFHSRISAEGFRGRLERVTGLDYRIVTTEADRYQVAFGYRDEAERQAALAAIESATGLAVRNDVL